MKKVVVILVVAACGAGAWFAFFRKKGDDPEAARTRTVKVKRAKVTHAIETNGEVRPAYSIELKSKASGQVVMFNKSEGDAVKPTEILVELDQLVEKRNLERAQASLEEAKAKRELTSAEYDRAIQASESDLRTANADHAVKKSEYERLHERLGTSVTQKEVDAAKLAQTTAEERVAQITSQLAFLKRKRTADDQLNEATVKQADTALKEAEDRMADTRLKAPIEGILLKKMVIEGQIVSSGISNVGGGTSIAVIADVSRLLVIANVVESDVGKVHLRQKARVSASGSPEKKFDGVVVHVPPQTEVEQGITYFKVQIAVEAPEAIQTLKVGMTANVELIVNETKDEVLTVPSEAVLTENGKHYLRVPRPAAPAGTAGSSGGVANEEKIEVEVGLDSGLDAEITKGVKEGDEILVPVTESEGMFGRRGGRRRRH